MNKKLLNQIIIIICGVLLMLFSSCQRISKPNLLVKEDKFTNVSTPLAIRKANKNDMAQAYNSMVKMLETVKIEKIVRIQMDYHDMESGSFKVIESTDIDIIIAWKNMLNRMDIKAVQMDFVAGTGYSLTFFSENNEYAIGGLCLPYIYSFDAYYQDKIMYEIVNIADLRSELNAIYEAIGYPYRI